MDDRIFLESPQGDPDVFYGENEISLCNVDDFIVFGDNRHFGCEDPQYTDIEGEANTLLIKDETKLAIDVPVIFDDNSKQIPTKRWKQKEVVIQTMESQFKVFMWIKDETIDEEDSPTGAQMKAKPVNQALKSSLSHEECQLKPSMPSSRLKCYYKSCQKTFKDVNSLRKHLSVHGPRTFICAECGKSFVEASKLKRHHLVHSGEKPFQCTFDGCGKRFSLDFNLRTHTRIHTGVRPFVCPVQGCQKSFIQSTNLKSHVVTHAKATTKKVGR